MDYMKIISWNVNGLRSVHKKGFLDWFGKIDADIVCLQETKANPTQLTPDLINVDGYYSFFNSAEKKGYSGLAVYTKEKPLSVENLLGFKRFDSEGRFLTLEFPNFVLINIYLPNGGRQKENMDYKLEVYTFLLKYLEKMKDKKIILIGDFNIAHKEIDLARPRENQNNTMFTPEERRQLDKLIELGFVDSFRKFNKEPGNYTWWLYSANARERNMGWRIDYIFVSEKLNSNLKDSFILPDVKGSDHCPIGIKI